jgi:hypothetical protein
VPVGKSPPQKDESKCIRMKTPFHILLVLLIPLCGNADDAKSSGPPELAILRQEKTRDLQQSALPILQRYLRNLDTLKAQLLREGRFDDLPAIQAESKQVQQEIDTAVKAADLSNEHPQDLTILSATYGDLWKPENTIDVTEQLRKALASGEARIKLNNDLADGKDPAPGTGKQMRIDYAINGLQKEKVFFEDQTLNPKDDLR